MKKALVTACAGLALAAGAALNPKPVRAIPLVFNCIAVGNAANCAVGESQLLVEVVEADSGQVAFIFSNAGPSSSAIARIYVDDERGVLAGPPVIHQDAPDVLFEVGVSPPNLPGGSSADPAFDSSPALGVMAATPRHLHGVNGGEHVGLVYPLASGSTFGDILADLSAGNLRLAIHVVGFTSNGHESFITQLLLTETLE